MSPEEAHRTIALYGSRLRVKDSAEVRLDVEMLLVTRRREHAAVRETGNVPAAALVGGLVGLFLGPVGTAFGAGLGAAAASRDNPKDKWRACVQRAEELLHRIDHGPAQEPEAARPAPVPESHAAPVAEVIFTTVVAGVSFEGDSNSFRSCVPMMRFCSNGSGVTRTIREPFRYWFRMVRASVICRERSPPGTPPTWMPAGCSTDECCG